MMARVLCLLVTTVTFAVNSFQELVPLNFSLMVSNAAAFNTFGVVPAIDNVVDLINNDSSLLPGYKLQYELLQHQCDLNSDSEILADLYLTKLAVVGCGCSTITEVLAKNQTIPIVSYASSSSVLSDRSAYPTLFRTVPSDETLAPALATLMNYYGWRKLAILTEKEPQFQKLLQFINTSLTTSDISFNNAYVIDPVSTLPSGILDGQDRVVFINTSPSLAVSILCMAHIDDLYFPSYVWLLPGWFMLSDQSWWTTFDYDSSDCTLKDVVHILNRSLILFSQPMKMLQNTTVRFTAHEYAFDAVLSIAYALNGSLFDIISYDENIASETLISLLQQTALTNPTTKTGEVAYDMEGNRKQVMVLVEQYRFNDDSTEKGGFSLAEADNGQIVAIINMKVFTYINEENNTSVWLGEDIPPIVTKVNLVKTWAYGLVSVMVVLGMTFGLMCLIFNIVFKNRKIVKLTSPNLNYIIIIAIMLLQSGNLLSPIPSANEDLIAILCNLAKFIRAISYDFYFVIALVKTFRVVYILKRTSPLKKSLTDWHLLLIAMAIIMIDFVVTVPLLALSYSKNDTALIEDKEVSTTHSEEGYTVRYYIWSCGITIYYQVWLFITVTYKLIIHIVGAVLAFISRKAKVDPFSDAKYTAIIVYVSCVVLFLTLVINLTTQSYVNVHTLSWTMLVFGGSCTILGLTFVPKMVALYKDPRGLTLFTKPGTYTTHGLSRISHHPTITEIGTLAAEEPIHEEMKEKITKEVNKDAINANCKEMELGTFTNTDIDQISSTVISENPENFKEGNNGYLAQGNQEIEAQDGKIEDRTAEDAKTSTMQIPPKRRGISWKAETRN